ncbi:MAG TPA: hypothetical protein VE521_05130 [Nitrososphaera sp.]|jgi:hypothetical protein|nr:hypothetical protein [Nitrososphaera sp.]
MPIDSNSPKNHQVIEKHYILTANIITLSWDPEGLLKLQIMKASRQLIILGERKTIIIISNATF